jgi:hypothetical protein
LLARLQWFTIEYTQHISTNKNNCYVVEDRSSQSNAQRHARTPTTDADNASGSKAGFAAASVLSPCRDVCRGVVVDEIAGQSTDRLAAMTKRRLARPHYRN